MNKLYTDWATIYDEIYQQLFDYNKDFAFYDSHLQAHNAHKILELGCGTGHLALKFCSNGYIYTGMDMSTNMLALAQARVPDAVFIESDIRQFEIAEKFDAVLMTGRTISYLIKNMDLIQTFECILKVLKSGGLLIFDAIYLLSMIERAQNRSQLLRVVEAVKDIFEDDVAQKSDWWDDLSPAQQKELEEALAECDDPTKLISHEEATKQIELWLKE